MAFIQAFGYELFVGAATNANDAHPANTTGLTELLNATDAGIQINTQTTDVVTYDSTGGFAKSLATGQDYSISCSVVIDPNDSGYKLLKDAALGAVAGEFIKWYRLSPIGDGATRESHAGIAQVTGFSESIQAGGLATCSFTLKGFDAPTYTAAT